MTEATIDRLNASLAVVRQRGRVFDARCPAHDDQNASLTFGYGETGGVVMHCHAGCPVTEIVTAAGLTMADLSPEPHIVAVYEYRDEFGELLWTVERWQPKDFRVRPSLPPVADRRLYHSEWLPEARRTNRVVWVVEGEKDADRMAKESEIAVCGVGGAGKWLPAYTSQLADLRVRVVSDDDNRGRAHARAVVRALDGVAAEVSLEIPSGGKDVSDHLDAGYSLDALALLPVDEEIDAHRLDRVRIKEVAWLWPGYLPMGKLAIIEGDPGDGKSVLTIDLAARLSTGSPLPGGLGRCPLGPINVAMLSAEDDPEDTIAPRLAVAGAHAQRVHLITGGPAGLPFDLGRDLGSLEALVQRQHIRLITIDPLMAFMPADMDSHRDHDVRRALHPLSRMAARSGCAVLVVRHLTKGRTKAIYAGGGSIAFIGAARVGYLVGVHPDDEDKRVLSCVKINIGVKPPALAYQIVSDEKCDMPRLVWDPTPLVLSAQEVLDGASGTDERDLRDDARGWLYSYLCDHQAGKSWTEIVRAAKRELGDVSEMTLRRVRKQVAFKVVNPVDTAGAVHRGVFWRPLASDTDSDTDAPLAQPAHVNKLSKLSKRPQDAHSDEAPLSTESELSPGPCDVCQDEPAVIFAAHGAVRCRAHSPMTYGGS
ncbi:MAG: AAA family ATPase [Pseudonocardiales bacterium]